MGYFGRRADALSEPQAGAHEGVDTLDELEDTVEAEQIEQPNEQHSPVGARLTDFRDRISRALTNFDRGHAAHPSLEPGETAAASDYQPETFYEQPDSLLDPPEAHGVIGDVTPRLEDSRFPVSPLGYHRGAVDERIAALENELEELRNENSQISITEEIEKLGEQTASILVVAHDQAHETTRQAQQQAERCIADAAANAVAMTEQAKRNLREIDNETDAVWRERARLLDDARSVGLSLIALAEEGLERFPEETKAPEPLA
jgi:DivIVA protein